jgi:hypothetical protein
MKENEMSGECSAHRGHKKCLKILIGKPEGMKPLGRLRCSLEDNIKMDLREIGCKGVDWIHLAQDTDR